VFLGRLTPSAAQMIGARADHRAIRRARVPHRRGRGKGRRGWGRAIGGCAVEGRAMEGRAIEGRAVEGRLVWRFHASRFVEFA